MSVNSFVRPLRHDQPRHTVRRPLSIPREVQPFRQLDLRDQQEDRRGDEAPTGFRP